MVSSLNPLRGSRAGIPARDISRHVLIGALLLFGGVLLPCGALPAQSTTPGQPAPEDNRNLKAQSPSPLRHPSQVKPEDLRADALVLLRKATRSGLAKAAVQLRQSARLFRAQGRNAEAARDYTTLGDIHLMWSQYQQALGMYQLALQISRPSDIDLQSSALSHIAVVYSTISKIKLSLRYAQRAVDTAKRGAPPQVRAEAMEVRALAQLYSSSGPEQALKDLRAAREMLKNTDDLNGLANSFLYTGFGYFEDGKTADTLDDESHALELWTTAGDLYGVARARVALGLVWRTLGEPEKALADYDAARQTFKAIGDLDNEAIALNGLGGLSQAKGNYEESLENYRQAAEIFARVGDPAGQIEALRGQAEAYRSMGLFQQALRLYRTRFDLVRRTNSPKQLPTALLNLGDVYAAAHDFGRALSLYEQALALCRKQNNKLTEAEVEFHLADFYQGQGSHEKTLRSLNAALRLSERTGHIVNVARAHFELAALYRDRASLDDARREIEQTIDIIESQRVKVSDFSSRAFYFASVHKYYQLYIDVLMGLHREHPEQEFARLAFEEAEKSKVRSLLDELANTAGDADCRRSPSRAQATSSAGGPQETPANGQPGKECALPQPTALTLAQVQAAIRGDDALLLEYALGKDGGYLWAVDETGISVYELPGLSQFQQLARNFLDSLTARLPRRSEAAMDYSRRVNQAEKDYPKRAADLSNALLGPVSHLLTRKRIIIVPDGQLPEIPYAAVPLPVPEDRQARSMPEHFVTVVSMPSASILDPIRRAAEKRTPRPAAVAVFADPVYESDDPRIPGRNTGHDRPGVLPASLQGALTDLGGNVIIPRLPSSSEEARMIKESMPGQEVMVATGFKASKEAVLHGGLGRYRYLHFSTHGLLDTRHPEFSGLLLSLFNEKGQTQDGYLKVKDIFQLHLAADLVVLSACETALGKDLKSEGTIGLPRAFLSSGARSVVSSLWKVDDEATAELMKRFYQRLHAGDSTDTALRRAQAELAQIKDWRNPFYWAAFILQGDYR